jgi:hypothetical protein
VVESPPLRCIQNQEKETMNIGIETLRAGLRLTIHRGGVGNRPNRLSASHPVADGETILSGMVITPVRNTTLSRNEWVRGVTGDSLDNSFYIAVDDSADGDVAAAGSLQGLSVRGDYEISTSQFKAGESYVTGDPLTAVSSGAQGGVFTPAKDTNAQDLQRLRVELVAPYELP